MLSREIHLKSYPKGLPSSENFELTTVTVSEDLGDKEVLVRNLYMSVDPYMRGRMSGKKTYVDPFALNEALTGGAVGRVVASRHNDWPVGTLVSHFFGWREAFKTADGRQLTKLPDMQDLSPSVWLGALGMPGLTAYAGLLEVAAMKEGETVFVSGAAGAVGAIVGQIAKIKKGRVIGSCGTSEKAAYLTTELGFDTALNYRQAPIAQQLAQAAPDGIDVYFDNVGGDHLEAALPLMKNFGRIALCGAIAQYNDQEPGPGPKNLAFAIIRRLTLRGFIVSDFAGMQKDFVRDMSLWMKEGQVKARETIVEGLDQALPAFLGLFKGENTGKMLVRL